MQFTEMNKNKHSNNTDTKYYITSCQTKINQDSDTTKWIKLESLIKHTRDIHIFEGILNKTQNIVVKSGIKDTIKKEYEISKALKDLPNFIKYICYFTCKKNKEINFQNSLCSASGDEYKIILMPYYQLGSVEKYNWDKSNFHILKSVIKQLFLSQIIAFQKNGFVHNDSHPGNFLLRNTSKNTISYSYNDKIYNIPSFGLKVIIMDFEQSFIKIDDIYFLYMGFKQIINDIEFKLKIQANGIYEIINYIELHIKNKKLFQDIDLLLNLIDNLEFISKKEIKKLIYDPFNF